MLIGVDFDNTIVRYDRLFHRLAVERGLIPADVAMNKTAVRDYLRNVDREDDWTELQGTAYGPEIVHAEPFPGVLDFFHECRRLGVPVCIVSHKTRHPYRGPNYDLHEWATIFLREHGFLDEPATGLGPSNVYLELTKHAKLARIGAVGCTHFIDDLPEFLAEETFPSHVERLLFDPEDLYADDSRWRRIRSWSKAADVLLRDARATEDSAIIGGPSATPAQPPDDAVRRLLVSANLPAVGARLESVVGSGNNRGYRLTTADDRSFFLKWYFRHPDDPRDRLGTEYAFTDFCRRHGIDDVPRPLARDDDAGLALFEFVEGRRPASAEIDDAAIGAALGFYRRLNEHRDDPDAERLPIASEACFSVQDHVERIGRRVQRLVEAAALQTADPSFREFVVGRLAPAWSKVYERIDQRYPIEAAGRISEIAEEDQRLSPSDFGFHNALRTPDGRIRFIDLEYAGWDGPSKLVCDFFCQVQVPVPRRYWKPFVETIAGGLSWPVEFARRAATLLPAYRIKWCCIVLNVFLPTDSARRTFGTAAPPTPERLAAQLQKAQEVLEQLPEDLRS